MSGPVPRYPYPPYRYPMPQGGNCAPVLLPPAYRYHIRSLSASAFSTLWVVAQQRNGLVEGPGELLSMQNMSLERQVGGQIHPGNTAIGQQATGVWHHISIAVDGELKSPNGTAVEAPEIGARGWRSTLFKARVTLMMGNSKQREFDFDIGAGVEFDVKAQAVQSIELLVPDPAGIIVPLPVTPPQVDTVLTTTVYCGQSPSCDFDHLRYSQPFLVTGGFTEWWMPRMPDATELVLETDDFSAAGVIAQVEFMDVQLGGRVPPTYGPIPNAASAIPVGGATIATNQANSPKVPIPGSANAMRITITAPAPTVVNAIQILDV